MALPTDDELDKALYSINTGLQNRVAQARAFRRITFLLINGTIDDPVKFVARVKEIADQAAKEGA